MKNFIEKNKQNIILFIIILLIALACKILQFYFLEEKYFFDSNYILLSMKSNDNIVQSFNFAVKFFELINIFNFNSTIEWSIFLSIVFSIVMFFVFSIKKKYNLFEYFFIVASLVLLNIYVFNLGKDLIQFLIFLFIFIIILNKRLSFIIKVLLISLVFVLESLVFRKYYLIILVIFLFIVILYQSFNLCQKKSCYLIVFSVFGLFLGVLLIKFLSYDNYKEIVLARYYVNVDRIGSSNAITIINNLLSDSLSYLKFVVNYVINFVRINLPFELLFKGFKYIPYIIYQVFITFNVYLYCRKVNKTNIMNFAMIVAFLLVLIIFEPDFGSFLRHQSAFSLFYYKMILDNNEREVYEK